MLVRPASSANLSAEATGEEKAMQTSEGMFDKFPSLRAAYLMLR
jgi:hypothetical protein